MATEAKRLDRRSLAVVLNEAVATPGTPGKVTFILQNHHDRQVEVVSSAFEVKRSIVGARHALPKAGWGYAVTTAVATGTALAPCSELKVTFKIDDRTTFHGAIPIEEPLVSTAQLYFAGRLLYRRVRGELLESCIYRRLTYPNLSFSLVESGDEDLNRTGTLLFAARAQS